MVLYWTSLQEQISFCFVRFITWERWSKKQNCQICMEQREIVEMSWADPKDQYRDQSGHILKKWLKKKKRLFFFSLCTSACQYSRALLYDWLQCEYFTHKYEWKWQYGNVKNYLGTSVPDPDAQFDKIVTLNSLVSIIPVQCTKHSASSLSF